MGWFDDRRSIWQADPQGMTVPNPAPSGGMQTAINMPQTFTAAVRGPVSSLASLGRSGTISGDSGMGRGLAGAVNLGSPTQTAMPAPSGAPAPQQGGAPSMPLEQAIQQYQQQNPYSPQAYLGLYDHLRSMGYQVERPTHAGGTMQSDDKIVGPDGKMYDLISGVDGANPQWAGASHIPGEYWFNGQRVQRPEELGPGGMSLGGANHLAPYSAQGLLAPYTREFQRPDPNSIRNDPSYQFQMQEGQDALQRSAANRGTLLTGSTLKDIVSYGQGLASTFDDKYWDRAFKIDNRDIGLYDSNVTRPYNMLSGMAGQGQNAASSYAANVGGLYQQGGNVNAANTGVQNQAGQNMDNTFAELLTAYARRPKTPTNTTMVNNAVPKPAFVGDANRPGGAYA